MQGTEPLRAPVRGTEPLHDPGDPVAQTLAAMQQQGALPNDHPATGALPPEMHVQSMMQNLLHSSLAARDSSIPQRAIAAIFDMLDAGRHGVQSLAGTDQGQMDAAYKKLAENMPAPRTSDLMSAQGMQRYVQELLSRGETDRRWSPETVKLAGDTLTDPTSYLGVGLFKGLAKGAARGGLPQVVQKTLKAAQAGDEAGVEAMGFLADTIITGVQKGVFGAPNAALGKVFPELPKWTEYAKNTKWMGDALQWLDARSMDLTTIQAGVKQGTLQMADVLDQLPAGIRQNIDARQLEMAVLRMPDDPKARNVAKWATNANPTQDRNVAYEAYKRWLRHDMGIDDPNRARTFLSNFGDWWKQQALGSLGYLETNLKGGLLGAALETGPAGAARIGADALDNMGNILRAQPFNTQRATELSTKTGLPIPASLHEAADRALNATQGQSSTVNLLGSTGRDVGLGAGVGALGAYETDQDPIAGALIGGATVGAIPKIATRIRKSSQGIETVLREGAWVEGTSKQLARDVLDLNAEVANLLLKPGARGGTRRVTTMHTIPGAETTTEIPAVAESVTGIPARAATPRSLAEQGVGEAYHLTDPGQAIAWSNELEPSVLQGLAVSPDLAGARGRRRSGALVKFTSTDQLGGSAQRGGAGYVIEHSAARPEEVIESITLLPGTKVGKLQAQYDALEQQGWAKAVGDDGATVYTNPAIQPWASTVLHNPAQPAASVVTKEPDTVVAGRTRNYTPRPVAQSFIDRITDLIEDEGGQVSADQIRQILLSRVKVTPQRAEEAARMLDDVLYSASQRGSATSDAFNFDYQDLSNVERAITTVAPFATWYLKAVPFFTKQGFKHPVLTHLVGNEREASAEMAKEKGLSGRFTGTLPDQNQTGLMTAILGRPMTAFHDPIGAMLPGANITRDAQTLGYEMEKDDPDPLKIALGLLKTAGLSLRPDIEAGLRVAGLGYGMDDPSSSNLLRMGAPIAGATALAAKGVEAATGTNPGWNLNTNRGVQAIEERLREAGDAATHGGQGRQVQDLEQLAIEKRVDELALKQTGQPIGSKDAAVAPYVRAKTAKTGKIWEQAKNEIAQERGTQALLGFASPDLRPDALLTPEEEQIRGAKTGLLLDGSLTRKLDSAAEKTPTAPVDEKTREAVLAAVAQVAEQQGQPTPQVVQDRLAKGTYADFDWVAKEIYKFQVEADPTLQGYGSGGSMEARRIGNEVGLMSHAGQGLDPVARQQQIATNRTTNVTKGGLLKGGVIAAAKQIPGQEREAIKSGDPLLAEYLTWRATHPGLEVADFLREKYRR